ncbi:MAG: protein kinase [Myxococcota bacterium]
MRSRRSSRLGESIGPYTLLAEVARGGSGTVYEARAEGDETTVAVKVFELPHQADARRFLLEAKIRLQHPNIVKLLDAAEDETGTPYIVLELLEGEPMSRVLARRRLDEMEVIDLGIQVCRGLEVAHAQTIVHRDIKPSNLFYCSDGTVKILDFGIALPIRNAQRMTTTGKVVGTPGYLSPEQAAGNKELDRRVDIWGLGTVMYEALVGTTPFERETLVSTVFAILNEEQRPLSSQVQVSPSLSAVIDRCLAKKRVDRWPSATELRHALEEIALSSGRAPRAEKAQVIPYGEVRQVAALSARGVRDLDAFRRSVSLHGGVTYVSGSAHALAIFGGTCTEGVEAPMAMQAAERCEHYANAVGVAAGSAMSQSGGPGGPAIEYADQASQEADSGVVVHSSAKDVLTRLESFYGQRWRSRLPHAPWTQPSRRDPISGRTSELRQLDAVIEAFAQEGRGDRLLISGPLGAGKTALRFEFERRLEAALAEVRVLRAQAHPTFKSRPFGLFRDLIRRCLPAAELLDTPDVKAHQRMLRDFALHSMPSTETELALFGLAALMGVPVAAIGSQVPVTNKTSHLLRAPVSSGGAEEISAVLRGFFDHVLQSKKLALIIEDLHWADPMSLTFVEELADSYADAGLVALLTARPELFDERSDFMAGLTVRKLALRGVSPRFLASFLETLPGAAQLQKEELHELCDQAEGNPYLAQALLGSRERTAERARPGVRMLPPEVFSAVQSRLDHLPFLERSLLRRAAVFGRPFTAREIASLGVADAPPMLDALVRRGILKSKARRGASVREYRFQSSLMHEAIYETLSPEARAEQHVRVAMLLGDGEDPSDEEIATHYERSGDHSRAADYFGSAAVRANRQGRPETVLTCTDKVLELDPSRISLYTLYLQRGRALHQLGRLDPAVVALDFALKHASNDLARAEVHTQRARYLRKAGQYSDAEAAARTALSSNYLPADRQLAAYAELALSFLARSKLDAADLVLVEALPMAQRELGSASGRYWMAQAQRHLEVGTFHSAERDLQCARQLFLQAEDPLGALESEWALAQISSSVGDRARAEALLTQINERAQAAGYRFLQGLAWLELAYVRMPACGSDEAPDSVRGSSISDPDSVRGSSNASIRNPSTSDAASLEGAANALAQAEAILAPSGAKAFCLELRLLRMQWRVASQAEVELEAVFEELLAIAESARQLGTQSLLARTHALSALWKCRQASGSALEEARSESLLALQIRDERGGLPRDEPRVFRAAIWCLEALGSTEEAEALSVRGRARIEAVIDGLRTTSSSPEALRALVKNW